MKILTGFALVALILVLTVFGTLPPKVAPESPQKGQTSHRDDDVPDYPRVLHLATARTDPGCFHFCTIRYDCTELGPTDCPVCAGGECMGGQP